MRFFKTSSGAEIGFHDLPGEDCPILFIHGLGCASSCDYPEVACSHHLRNHRKLLVDLPGFGFSDKGSELDFSLSAQVNSLEELLQYLGLRSLVVFGHSMGGAIAIMLSNKIRGKVQTLIITEGNLDPGGGPGSRRIARYGREQYCQHGHDELIEKIEGLGNHHWASSLRVSNPHAVYQGAADLVNGTSPSWRQMLYSFDFPRTYIFGEHNLPNEDVEILKSNGINVSVVSGSGHNMAHENPEGLAERIREGC